MATIQDRPFSKNYSGLINQSVLAIGVGIVCIVAHEVMKRKRRGRSVAGLDSVESWEFGYLYQGRSWAKNPSPPIAQGWLLSWVKQAVAVSESKLHELRGVDATLYVRFLRACTWFALLHSLTTVPILLPIHVHFSDGTGSPRSMTRASISSLAATPDGKKLLWIHLILLFYVTFTWMAALLWICRGAFLYRRADIQRITEQTASVAQEEKYFQYYPHPHPQYRFQGLPSTEQEKSSQGLRLRTVMVTNIPPSLRSERQLSEYFTSYLDQPINTSSLALASSAQPGFVNRFTAFLFNRAKRIPETLPVNQHPYSAGSVPVEPCADKHNTQVVEHVVIARNMLELASLLQRREEILGRLEVAHIKLAKNTLAAVKDRMDESEGVCSLASRMSMLILSSNTHDVSVAHEDTVDRSAVEIETLVQALRPFVEEFGTQRKPPSAHGHSFIRLAHFLKRIVGKPAEVSCRHYDVIPDTERKSIWEALHEVPRHMLDAYQPLIHLSTLFRNRTVPAIDYYTAKLNLLTSLITESRAKAIDDYDPVSTAFVTFADPKDAWRACKTLTRHPNNPLICLVTMAPAYEDLDWSRIMKTSFRGEFLKDWVVNLGVWAFTLLWVFPVSFFVTLVSIQNISAFWPGLSHYLEHHPWEEELIQSLLPTVLVALLAMLIPLLHFLIAKKAHNIITLSALHDRIMTRYYKFLIVNVLVFFCLGTATLQSFLVSFASSTKGKNILHIVSDSFPSAGPFYVGWMIFTTAMHGAIELVLFGLPLFTYLATRRQYVPRKRAVGIRPRTFNFYYWLPNHLLVIHVILVFAIINPLVTPFALVYFMVETAVIKNQLLHVYAKNYEGNGQLLLIRIVRYSLDGLILAQAVFLAYMAVLKKHTSVGLSAVLIALTAFVKIFLTRICRTKHECDDMAEAMIVCQTNQESPCCGEIQNEEHCSGEQQETSGPSTFDLWRWRLFSPFNFTQVVFTHHHHATEQSPKPRMHHCKSDDQPPLSVVSNTSTHKPHLSTSAFDLFDLQRATVPRLVSSHPRHPIWNDESNFTHPYDNPYYTQPFSNALWLPRNPCGIVNLNDTVDVRMSLTTSPSTGQLGVWVVPGGALQPPPSSQATLMENQPARTTILPPLRFDGTEEITLPVRIASRVNALEYEKDIDYVRQRRPSLLGARGSSDPNTAGRMHPRPKLKRPNTFDVGPSRTRTMSSGSMALQSPPSRLSVLNPWYRSRAVSMDQERGVCPDQHTRADFVDSPIQFANTSTVMFPRAGTFHRPESVTISMHEAVTGEVIVEEQEATKERLRIEAQALQDTSGRRPRWTGWFFSKAE